MVANPPREEDRLLETDLAYRRIGHKGADAIRKGNTLESFEVAVECGVDVIELDVLRAREGRLIVAHDPEDALRRRPLDLTEALDAFLEPPLDKVEIDCDLKLAGREAELAGSLQGRGLLERAMVSTMEVESLRKLRQMEPDLRLGWTYPKTKRDWAQYGWASLALGAALSAIRRRFPATLARQGPELGIDAVWAYHPIITPRLVSVSRDIGVELIAWTVDDVARMRELIAMGVDGVCSNDPRLFEVAEREPLPAEDRAEPDAEEEPRRRRLFGIGRKRGG
ncbi:MAG TPA: glycerophosphodiester phosphodiesterase [Solirubrobacterales bacterium]